VHPFLKSQNKCVLWFHDSFKTSKSLLFLGSLSIFTSKKKKVVFAVDVETLCDYVAVHQKCQNDVSLPMSVIRREVSL